MTDGPAGTIAAESVCIGVGSATVRLTDSHHGVTNEEPCGAVQDSS